MSQALQKYVATYPGGIDAYAQLLGVTKGQVYRWLRRERTPHPNRIQRMITESKGQLTFEEIWESTTPVAELKAVKAKRVRQ